MGRVISGLNPHALFGALSTLYLTGRSSVQEHLVQLGVNNKISFRTRKNTEQYPSAKECSPLKNIQYYIVHDAKFERHLFY